MMFLHFCGGKGKPNTSPLWFRNSGWLLSNLKTDTVGAWVLQHQFRTGVSAVICRNPGRSIQMCSRICGAIITSGALTSRNEEHIRKEWDCVKKTTGSTDRLGGEKTS